jgi:hypothetical protein
MAIGDPSRRRLSTETKSFSKTSEFWMWAGVAVALLIAGNTIEGQEGGADYFAADKVWLYVTLLTIGYFISRGLAKAGSRDPYWEERDADIHGHEGAPFGERLKTAAKVLTDPDAVPGEHRHDTQPTQPVGTAAGSGGPGYTTDTGGRFER